MSRGQGGSGGGGGSAPSAPSGSSAPSASSAPSKPAAPSQSSAPSPSSAPSQASASTPSKASAPSQPAPSSQASAPAPSSAPSASNANRGAGQQSASPSPASKPVSRGDLNPQGQTAGRDAKAQGVSQTSSASPKQGQSASNQISRTDGGRTSEMTYSADQMKNPRQTPEGRSADAKARSGTFAETGRDASHRHSLSGNAPAGDKGNLYAGNSIQNRAGGTKHAMEKDRDAQVKADPSVSVKERSTMLQKDGSGKPIAEKVEQSTYRDGKATGEKREVIFGNFSSSSSRHADAAKAQGQ